MCSVQCAACNVQMHVCIVNMLCSKCKNKDMSIRVLRTPSFEYLYYLYFNAKPREDHQQNRIRPGLCASNKLGEFPFSFFLFRLLWASISSFFASSCPSCPSRSSLIGCPFSPTAGDQTAMHFSPTFSHFVSKWPQRPQVAVFSDDRRRIIPPTEKDPRQQNMAKRHSTERLFLLSHRQSRFVERKKVIAAALQFVSASIAPAKMLPI